MWLISLSYHSLVFYFRFLEIFESAELQGVIFFETVVNYVKAQNIFLCILQNVDGYFVADKCLIYYKSINALVHEALL